MTRDEMRLALERAWADTLSVAEAIRASQSEAGPSVRLAVREITGGLLALDRIVASKA
jgi:hypothetical protein